MELLRCRRESVENVRKSANVTSMVSCRIFPSRPRKTPWKIPHGNLRRFTGHHCEFQSYRTLYQTTRGGFWSVVFFLIFENHHIFEPGSWEPSKHMYQGGRSEFLLVELWPSVSVHETHSISIVHRILQVCRDNLQGFLTCWGIQLMTVSFDPRCSSVRALLVPWHRHRHSQESNPWLQDRNGQRPAAGGKTHLTIWLPVVWSCLKLFEFCVYSCMYSANFRNKNMHGQEKREMIFTYITFTASVETTSRILYAFHRPMF